MFRTQIESAHRTVPCDKDAYDTISSVNQQQAQLQTQIAMQQKEVTIKIGKSLWEAYMRSYNLHIESQFMEAKTTATVAPRLIKAGVTVGAEMAFSAVVLNEIEKQTQNGNVKTAATVATTSFAAGFIVGAVKEIYNIFREAVILE